MKVQDLITRGQEFIVGEYRGRTEPDRRKGTGAGGKSYDFQAVVHSIECDGAGSVHVEQLFDGNAEVPVATKKGGRVIAVIDSKVAKGGVVRRSTKAIYPFEG